MMASHERTTAFDWGTLGWIVLGLVGLAGAYLGFVVASHQLPIWLCADRYVDAELEVTRYYPDARRRATLFEGVIHPGGARVASSNPDIARLFIDANVREGRRLPSRDEIEGRRRPICYLPRDADEVPDFPWNAPEILPPGDNLNLGARVGVLRHRVPGPGALQRVAHVAANPGPRPRPLVGQLV